MKKIFNFIIIHPIYFLIIFICVVFLPGAIIARPQTESKLIIRALGIDRNGENYEISAIAFLPKASQSFTENYKVVEGKGKTLYEAISEAAKETGKDIGLAHTGIVFVNDGLCEEGLIESIDYLVRDYSLANGTFVVYVPNSTKDLIKAANNLVMSSGIRLGDVADFDEENVLHAKSNIESIYDSAYSPSKCSLMNVMEISGNEGLEAGEEQAEGDSESGQSSQSGRQQEEKKILNQGKILVLKAGKKAILLDENQTNKYKWTKSSKFSDTLILKDFSDKNFKNANISLIVNSNDVKYDLDFKDGKPIYTFVINPRLSIIEVNQDGIDDNIFLNPSDFATDKLKTTINNKIKNEVYDIINIFIENKTDVNSVYEYFNAEKTSDFQKYLLSLENKEDFLSGIDFYVEVNCVVE